MNILTAPFGLADFSDPKTIIALIIAVIGIVFLFLSKSFATKLFQKKYPDKDANDKENEEKLLNYTLIFKSIAAAIAVCACILALL